MIQYIYSATEIYLYTCCYNIIRCIRGFEMTPLKCPYCESCDAVKRGFSPTAERGRQQRYLCRACKRTFIPDAGFWKMKNRESVVTMSIDMYLSNLSSRKMRNQLLRHFNVRASHMSVLAWVRKYVLRVGKFVDRLFYGGLGSDFYADETEINREGERDSFWACVDWKTRMITGIHYSVSANPREAVEFLRKAVNKGMPESIQTDAALFYPRAFRKAFYSNKVQGLCVEHRVQNYRKTKIHNYKIETVFMKLKDRVNDFRGLKALWSAPILLAGIVLQHNFIEKHSTTGKVPCELAGQELSLGGNRWMGLIERASGYI